MYLLFERHNITPMQFHAMGIGQHKILKAFIEFEIENEIKQNKKMNSKPPRRGRR